EHDFGAVYVRLNRSYRALHDQLHADCCGEVEDDIAVIDHSLHSARVVHRTDRETKARVVFDRAQVLHAPGGEVIENGDRVAARTARPGQVGADEPRTAGNQNSQQNPGPGLDLTVKPNHTGDQRLFGVLIPDVSPAGAGEAIT